VQPQRIGSPENEGILAVAKQLCAKLGLKASTLDRLLWRDFLHDVRTSQKIRVRWYGGRSFGHMLSAHFPILFDRTLVLRDMMKGKLDPGEWEPLICSSIIFYERFRWRRYVERSLALLPFFASFTFAVGSWITYRFLGYPLPPWQASAALFVVFLVSPFFPGLYLIRHFDRRLVLAADRKTALILGKGRLLQVLQKVEAMKQADLVQGEDGQNEWRDFMFVPKATERVKHLRES